MLTLLLIVLAIAGLLVVMRREAGATPALALLGVLGLVGVVLGAPVIGTLLLVGAAAVAVSSCDRPALERPPTAPADGLGVRGHVLRKGPMQRQ